MIKCTLGDLIEFNKINNDIDNQKFKVNTRKGVKKIKTIAVTAINSKQIKIVTASGKFIIGSPDHLLFYKEWKKIKHFLIGDSIETIDGIEIITNIELFKHKRDLLDIEVEEVKEFYANGFVSHNSTIAEVITFALYGKVERKNKYDLPNRINKNLWCQIKIKAKNKKVIIERGLSPNSFIVNIDGVDYDTAGTANVQDYLEFELFDIPYQVFKNIIVLSINDFKSFLTMSPGDKRNIVDRLFGFTVINQMRDQVKNEKKLLRENLKTITDELGIIEESIESINKKIIELEKDKKEDKLNKIQENKQKIIELITQKKQVLDNINKIKTLEVKLHTEFENKRKEFSELSYALKTIDTKIDLYKNSICPTCGSNLHTKEHHKNKEHAEVDRDSKKITIDQIDKDIKLSQDKLKTIKEKSKEIESSKFRIDALINQYKTEVDKLLEKTEQEDSTYLTSLIEENENKKLDKKRNQSELSMDDKFLDLVESILGEDGVKNLAMKTILPSLNLTISNMSKQMHMPYSIKFDDKFDCIVNSMGEEINPRSMSTGERKKADFIIIIALLKILKIRYPSLNLLFLDEIFSSIDGAGVYEIIKILNDISKEQNINIWVINHAELPTELFDWKVEARKESGFSKLYIENIT